MAIERIRFDEGLEIGPINPNYLGEEEISIFEKKVGSIAKQDFEESRKKILPVGRTIIHREEWYDRLDDHFVRAFPNGFGLYVVRPRRLDLLVKKLGEQESPSRIGDRQYKLSKEGEWHALCLQSPSGRYIAVFDILRVIPGNSPSKV